VTQTSSRRQFLNLAAGSAATAALWSLDAPRASAAIRPGSPAATSLGEGFFLLTGAGGNVVAYRGTEGLLLIDGGDKARSAALLKLALKSAGAKRVHTLFNTHWHPEQTGSNERLGKDGTRIIAHENTRLWLTRKIRVDWLPAGYGPLPPKALPSSSFYTTETLAFGDESLRYGHLGQAHTDGDLYVYFEKANLLAAGGVVSSEGWPLLDWQTGGWIGGLVGAYDRLLKVANDTTRVVPANGPVIDRKALQAHRDMYFTIFDRCVKLLVKGQGPEEVVAAQPAKEFADAWGNPDVFVEAAFKSLWGHYAPDA
jgi:cyclase